MESGVDKGAGGVPASLAPFLPEYELDRLTPERDAVVIIERTLEHGAPAEVVWLFDRYGAGRVRQAVRERGRRHLSPRALNFWCLVLDIDPATCRPHPWPDLSRALWAHGG